MTDARFFQKMHLFKAAILLYKSSLERNSGVKLKETQLSYLVIKLTKPFTVPKACTRWKTKRGIGITFFRADFFKKCTDLKQPYCFIKSSLERKKFVKMKETDLFYLVI